MSKEVVEQIMRNIIEHLKLSLDWIDETRLNNFLQLLLSSERVYIVGVGKSGLIGKIFGLSLVSLNYEVYIVGESLLPAPRPVDLIVAISGTGETDYPIRFAKIGKKTNAKIVTITSREKSTLAKLSNLVIHIPGREDGNKQILEELTAYGEHGTLKGMLFEMATLAYLNAVIGVLTELKENHQKRENR